jgi:hypothetical protein
MADAAADRHDPGESLYRGAHVQQDEVGNAPQDVPPGDISPDSQDRIRDFLDRHGGPGAPRRAGTQASGYSGWYEIYAADGYCLRCEWSRTGTREELKFFEIAHRSTQGASDSPG